MTATLNRCKTCRHWKVVADHDDDSYRIIDITRPVDPENHYEPMKMPYETRKCAHPAQAMFEHPPTNPGFALTDGSRYYAALATTEDFGCVMHEPRDKA